MNSSTISTLAGLAAFAVVAVWGAVKSGRATRTADAAEPFRLGLGQGLADCAACARTTVHQLHRSAPPTCLTCMTTPESAQ